MRFRNVFSQFFLSLSLLKLFFYNETFYASFFFRYNEKSKMKVFGAYFNNSAIQSGSQQNLALISYRLQLLNEEKKK